MLRKNWRSQQPRATERAHTHTHLSSSFKSRSFRATEIDLVVLSVALCCDELRFAFLLINTFWCALCVYRAVRCFGQLCSQSTFLLFKHHLRLLPTTSQASHHHHVYIFQGHLLGLSRYSYCIRQGLHQQPKEQQESSASRSGTANRLDTFSFVIHNSHGSALPERSPQYRSLHRW